jgi:signal transduction histidine kinase
MPAIKLSERLLLQAMLAMGALLLLLMGLTCWQLWQTRDALSRQPAIIELSQAPDRLRAALATMRVGVSGGREEFRTQFTRIEEAINAIALGQPVFATDGRALTLRAPETERAELVNQWRGVSEVLRAVASTTNPTEAQLIPAATAVENTVQGLREKLTAIGGSSLDRQAESAAFLVFGVILLTLIGMAVMAWLVHSLRRELKAQRTEVEVQKLQAQSILGAIGDGLLLLDREYKIGSQFSPITEDIFNRKGLAGMSFFELVDPLVTEKTKQTAADYMDLLFGERVNEKLVQDLNPLDVVEFHFDHGKGGFDTKFLAFNFKRVFVEGKLEHLLVVITDITRRIKVEKELRAQQEKTQAQMDMMVELLHLDPDTLGNFLPRAREFLQQVNNVLKEPARDASAFRAKLDPIFRLVHSLKGEAGMVQLKSFELGCHELEALLSEMRVRANLSGNDFLTFTIKLEELFTQLDAIRVLLGRLTQLKNAFEAQSQRRPLTQEQVAISDSLPALLDTLAQQVAVRHGKRVRLATQGLEDVPPAKLGAVRDVLVQFVRNAVVHGIESPGVRTQKGKPEVGQIVIVYKVGEQGPELLFRDDGAGIDAQHLRTAALKSGSRTREQLAKMSEQELLALVFEPSITTARELSEDAGRGFGLDIVRHRVRDLDGQLRLASAVGKGTQFKVLLKASA